MAARCQATDGKVANLNISASLSMPYTMLLHSFSPSVPTQTPHFSRNHRAVIHAFPLVRLPSPLPRTSARASIILASHLAEIPEINVQSGVLVEDFYFLPTTPMFQPRSNSNLSTSPRYLSRVTPRHVEFFYLLITPYGCTHRFKTLYQFITPPQLAYTNFVESLEHLRALVDHARRLNLAGWKGEKKTELLNDPVRLVPWQPYRNTITEFSPRTLSRDSGKTLNFLRPSPVSVHPSGFSAAGPTIQKPGYVLSAR